MFLLAMFFGCLGVVLFFRYWLIPFLKKKFTLWLVRRRIKKIARRYSENTEMKKDLEHIVDLLGQAQNEIEL